MAEDTDKRSLAKRLAAWSRLDPATGCIIWRKITLKSGYGRLSVGNKARRAHRVAWEVANGPIPAGMLVCHRCDVKACINLGHLFLGTPRDNMVDMVAKGRKPTARGERSNLAKLTEAEVRSILAAQGTQQAIADAHGVSRPLVSMIKSKKVWTHLHDTEA